LQRFIEMLIRSFEIGARTPVLLAAMLAALALLGCSVEGPAPPSLSSAPGLEPLAPGDASTCMEPPNFCDGLKPEQCCRNVSQCIFTSCGHDYEVCKSDVCVVLCAVDNDCISAGGPDAIDVFVCNDEKFCAPRGCSSDSGCGEGQQCIDRACFCTSNRGCNAGDVCSGEDVAATCIPAICESESKNDAGLCVEVMEDELRSGCSASGAGSSSGILLSALTLAGVLVRRRRRAQNEYPTTT
jgi:MYXO-CTERM domain-containing protein